jgi:hypothetical protein
MPACFVACFVCPSRLLIYDTRDVETAVLEAHHFVVENGYHLGGHGVTEVCVCPAARRDNT